MSEAADTVHSPPSVAKRSPLSNLWKRFDRELSVPKRVAYPLGLIELLVGLRLAVTLGMIGVLWLDLATILLALACIPLILSGGRLLCYRRVSLWLHLASVPLLLWMLSAWYRVG